MKRESHRNKSPGYIRHRGYCISYVHSIVVLIDAFMACYIRSDGLERLLDDTQVLPKIPRYIVYSVPLQYSYSDIVLNINYQPSFLAAREGGFASDLTSGVFFFRLLVKLQLGNPHSSLNYVRYPPSTPSPLLSL